MKKKIFLITAMVAMLVCTFAISVCAADIPEWTEITEIEGMTNKAAFGEDGKVGATSRVLMDDGKTYPAYYICRDSATLEITWSEIKSKTGISYGAANVVRIEVPNGITVTKDMNFRTADGYKSLMTVVLPEGVTNVAPYMFKAVNKGDSSLVSVSIPSTVTVIGNEAFHRCDQLSELIIPEGVQSIGTKMAYEAVIGRITFPSTLKSIGEQAFRSASLGTDAIVLSEGLTTIGSYAFKESGITSVTIPQTLETIGVEVFQSCANLKHIYYHAPLAGSNMFKDCSAVETLVIDNLVEAETYSFYGFSKLNKITLPETLQTVGNFAFAKLGVEEIVTPISLVNVGKQAFYSNTVLKRAIVLGSVMGDSMFADCSNLNEVVVTSRLSTFSSSNPLNGTPQTSYTIYFAGYDYEVVRALTSGNIRFNGPCCAYADFNRESYGTKNVFVYGTDICTLYFDGHVEDNNACVINCTRCAVSGEAEKNPEHREKAVISYEHGFDKLGTTIITCTNEGCTHKATEEAPALFACLGYSAPEDGRGGIAIGYTVNNEAIKEYTEATGKTLKYGVFAVLQSKLKDKDVFAEDGTVADGVINAEITNYEFVAFELKIVGFADEHKDIKLAMGAYVSVTDGETTEYSYLQSGTPNENEKYCFVSYNNIVGAPSNDEEVTQ